MNDSSSPPPIRWWPAIVILGVSAVAIGVARLWPSVVDFQIRNVVIFVVIAIALLILTIWWLLFSRAPWRMRLTVFAVVLALGGALTAVFGWRGVTGDFVPIFEPRWRRHAAPTPRHAEPRATPAESGRPDFPQYLGPQRNGVISDGPALARDWQKEPPEVLWRQPIGTAWSGFAIVGNRAVTLEQRGEQEMVTCLDMLTGKQLWTYGYAARFEGSYSGDGPRATPTISEGRVYTLGATGLVSCVTLDTGALVWQRDLYKDAKGGRPEWGYAGSPLVLDGKVIVSSGKSRRRSLFAYSVTDGKIVWRDGSQPGNYSSPCLLNLAGVPQIVMFNMTNITAHEPKTGAVLWEYPWGVRQPQIAQPVPVGPNRVAFSSSLRRGDGAARDQKGRRGQAERAPDLEDAQVPREDVKFHPSRRLLLRPRRRHPRVHRRARRQPQMEGRPLRPRADFAHRRLAPRDRGKRRNHPPRTDARGAERTHPLPRFLRKNLESSGTQRRSAFDAHRPGSRLPAPAAGAAALSLAGTMHSWPRRPFKERGHPSSPS